MQTQNKTLECSDSKTNHLAIYRKLDKPSYYLVIKKNRGDKNEK
jgi:hypothetical protein